MSVTIEQVKIALKQIIDPDFNKDIVALGFVQNIQMSDGDVSIDIALTTPACPVREEFRKKAKDLLGKLPGVKSVNVNLTTLKKEQLPQASNLSGLTDVRSIIAVSSCKGGVGKSTIAAHLAQEIARRGFKVGLVDCDIHGPSIPSLFNLPSAKVMANEKGQLIPIEKNNLKIISFGFFLGDAPAVMRGPIVTRYVQQILLNTAWGELDYLFLDMPPGTGDVQLTITQTIRLSGAVIVTTPQTLSLIDVARGILMFEKVNVPILGVIENMAYFICDNCDKKHFIFGSGVGKLNERFGIDVLAQLPILPQMILSIDKPLANDYIMQATDHVIRNLGKVSIEQRDVPAIQSDNTQITLTWKDGTRIAVSNRDLRLSCQCAVCVNELTGERLLNEKNIRPDIAAKEITPLGNYAINVAWNDGHSSGIYPYENIKKLGEKISIK